MREAFFGDLRAPFGDDELSKFWAEGDDDASYSVNTRARAIENRLNAVCGPDGWSAQYESTDQGHKCYLRILVPTRDATRAVPDENNGWRWLGKEGGITRSEIDSWYDEDCTNRPETYPEEDWWSRIAFRDAAQDGWGIGRCRRVKAQPGRVERSNIPLTSFAETRADANNQKFEVEEKEAERPNLKFTRSKRNVPARSPNGQEPQVPVDSPTPTPTPVPLDAATSIDPIQLPRTGGSAFEWAKWMERRFKTRVLGGMIADAKYFGWPENFYQWTPEMTRSICLSAAGRLMFKPNYKGEFDRIADEIEKHRKWRHVHRTVSGVALARLRGLLRVGLEKAARFHGIADPTPDDLREMLLNIAPLCENYRGSTGEVPESLEGMIDVIWMVNMLRHIEDIPATALCDRASVWEYSVDF